MVIIPTVFKSCHFSVKTYQKSVLWSFSENTKTLTMGQGQYPGQDKDGFMSNEGYVTGIGARIAFGASIFIFHHEQERLVFNNELVY